jgi:hypothetical protein
MRKDDNAFDRRDGSKLLHLHSDERCQYLRILSNFVSRRHAKIFIAAVPKPSAVLDPPTQMLQIDENYSVRSHDGQVNFPILPASVRLTHHKVGKALPGAGKRAA